MPLSTTTSESSSDVRSSLVEFKRHSASSHYAQISIIVSHGRNHIISIHVEFQKSDFDSDFWGLQRKNGEGLKCVVLSAEETEEEPKRKQ
ncbi:hypothetical protein Fmac_025293 [Flemingia macrophylla]|uniref:Uncharacterized protein n=1 Tax=Flemingia macrophylla TaxID=520843 RepID=A0ABD1LRS9_9FABA